MRPYCVTLGRRRQTNNVFSLLVQSGSYVRGQIQRFRVMINFPCRSGALWQPAVSKYPCTPLWLIISLLTDDVSSLRYTQDDYESILKDSDNGAGLLHFKESGFWTLSTVHCFLKNATFRKLDLFPSSGKMKVVLTLLGPLERASLNHWTNEDRSRSSFRNAVFLRKEWMMDKVQKPDSFKVIAIKITR
jgi:hypothetical protein